VRERRRLWPVRLIRCALWTMPFVDGNLAGDNRRSAAVAFFEDFEEVVTSGGIEGLEAPVIENKQSRRLFAGLSRPRRCRYARIQERKDAVVERIGRRDRGLAIVRLGEGEFAVGIDRDARFTSTRLCLAIEDRSIWAAAGPLVLRQNADADLP
jgi:hypothetical protein